MEKLLPASVIVSETYFKNVHSNQFGQSSISHMHIAYRELDNQMFQQQLL
jgi:hypothetical protein